MNCWKCKWKRNIPGSAHVRCEHPKAKLPDHPLTPLIEMLSLFGCPPIKTELRVKIKATGIRGGWAGHPLNFDPIWIEECEGFEEG